LTIDLHHRWILTPDTPVSSVSSTNKTDPHNITEILWKVALNSKHYNLMPFMSITTNLSISPVYEWISRFNRQNDPTTKVRVQINNY
jgi:hypothetical protein